MPHERPILLDIPERFVGERVVARPFSDADAVQVHDAIQESIEHIRPWLPWYDTHGTLDDTREYIRNTVGRWMLREGLEMGIFSRDDGTFLGGIGLHIRSWHIPAFEIGYWVRQSAEGHGYVSEATRLLTTFAFEGLGARRVMIRCDARNTRSAAVPQRLGYVLEGALRCDGLDTAGQARDTLIYAMIRDDYERARTAWP